MIEKVEHNGRVFALILRKEFEKDGVNFITANDNPIQLGVLKHKKGVEIKAHIHKETVKRINSVQEVLHIEYGMVEANFYDDGTKVGSITLREGDTILLIFGGHEFIILEDSKIIEIKQGPYSGVDEDKAHLEVK